MPRYYRRYPWPESWDKYLFGLLALGLLLSLGRALWLWWVG